MSTDDAFEYTRNPNVEGGSAKNPRELEKEVRSKTAAPGIAMIVIGGLGLLTYGGLMLAYIGMVAAGDADDVFFERRGVSAQTQLGLATVDVIIRFLAQGFIIMAGVNMLRLENYTGCRTGAWMAILPCTTTACCLGLPFGIWSLIVLNDSNVRTVFVQRSLGP